MRIEDIQFDRLNSYDVFIASCGYETRSSYLCRLGVKAKLRMAIDFPYPKGGAHDTNLAKYSEAGWTVAPLEDVLGQSGMAISKGATEIAIDISSMPRMVMAQIVEWLHARLTNVVTVHFVYCPGEFQKSSQAANLVGPMTAEPVSDYFRGALRAPSIPIGLIVGLGLEPHRAAGIVELLEPARTWLFSASRGDTRFATEATRVHQPLLSSADQTDIFDYDIRSLANTYAELDSLCFSAGLKYRLIMAPSGPKMFSLACMLIGAKRGDARPAVWRVGNAGGLKATDVHEAGDVSACEFVFAPA